MYPLKKFYLEKILKKFEIINLLDLINYNSKEAKKILISEFSWEDYG